MAVARLGFEDDFHRLFEELGITQSELATRLDVSEPYVSRLMNGKLGNLQLETMTKFARAFGAILQIRMVKDGEVVRVVDYETAAALDEKGTHAPAPSVSTSADGKLLAFRPLQSGRYRALTPGLLVTAGSGSGS